MAKVRKLEVHPFMASDEEEKVESLGQFTKRLLLGVLTVLSMLGCVAFIVAMWYAEPGINLVWATIGFGVALFASVVFGLMASRQ